MTLLLMQDPSAKEEIKRQLDLLWSERRGRLPLTVMALGLTLIYLPLWLTALCIIFDISAEMLSMRYMRALDPKRHKRRYWFVMACIFVMQFAFTLPPKPPVLKVRSRSQRLRP